MLKVDPIVYTVAEQAIITAEVATGKTGPELWQVSSLKPIRHRISVHTLLAQQCYCAFCEGILDEGTTSIEHITPKSKHREFTYEAQNLVSSCGRCNCNRIKGDQETIVNTPAITPYAANTFKIVHPILDDPDQHIVFQDIDRTIFDKPRCSQLGRDTIDFFHWDELNAYDKRDMSAMKRKQPRNIVLLVNEISTYKP